LAVGSFIIQSVQLGYCKLEVASGNIDGTIVTVKRVIVYGPPLLILLFVVPPSLMLSKESFSMVVGYIYCSSPPARAGGFSTIPFKASVKYSISVAKNAVGRSVNIRTCKIVLWGIVGLFRRLELGKISLNTWPGAMISISDSLNRSLSPLTKAVSHY
jgi:hypothetical protein